MIEQSEDEYKEFDWSINVKKVQNGYIVTPSSNSDGHRVMVFEDVEDDFDYNETKVDQETMRKVMWYLLDYFAVRNDKHANNGDGQYLKIIIDGDDE